MNSESWLNRPSEGVSAEKLTGSDQDCNVTNVSARTEQAEKSHSRRNYELELEVFVIPTHNFGASKSAVLLPADSRFLATLGMTKELAT
jgi:hypothetical protein